MLRMRRLRYWNVYILQHPFPVEQRVAQSENTFNVKFAKKNTIKPASILAHFDYGLLNVLLRKWCQISESQAPSNNLL